MYGSMNCRVELQLLQYFDISKEVFQNQSVESRIFRALLAYVSALNSISSNFYSFITQA